MHPERRPKGGSTVRSIFFTHLHSDHVIDYINLMLGFWPTERVDVFGPGEAGLPIAAFPPDRVVPVLFPDAPTPGIRVLTQRLFEAFAYNINVRIADEARKDVTANVFTHEIGVAHDDYVPDIDLGVEASGATIHTAAPPMDLSRSTRSTRTASGHGHPRATCTGVPGIRVPVRHTVRLGGVQR